MQAKLLKCILGFFLITGCVKDVTIRPPVNTSLGYAVFRAIGEINRAPLHLGLYFDPKLRGEAIRVSKGLGTVEVALGEVLSAKLIQALAYKFERITLIEDLQNAPSLLLNLALEGEGPAVGVDVKQYPTLAGAATIDVVAKVDTRLRAVLTDNGQTVWLGHARIVDEMISGGAAYGAFEGSSQAAELTGRLTDTLVADLMQQMQRSTELHKFLEAKK